VEIGLFNLPVYGDADLPGQEGDVDPQRMLLQSAGIRTFGAVATDTSGDEIVLIDDIQDAREAFYLVQALKGALGQ